MRTVGTSRGRVLTAFIQDTMWCERGNGGGGRGDVWKIQQYSENLELINFCKSCVCVSRINYYTVTNFKMNPLWEFVFKIYTHVSYRILRNNQNKNQTFQYN